MMRQLLKKIVFGLYYDTHDKKISKFIDQHDENVTTKTFNPNIQDELSGNTLLHLIAKRNDVPHCDVNDFEQLFFAGADPTIRNKKNQDMVDALLARRRSTIEKYEFTFFFLLLQRYYPEPQLLAKLLKNMPRTCLPKIQLNSLSLEVLNKFIPILEEKIQAIQTSINQLYYQAASEHEWAARKTYSDADHKRSHITDLQSIKNQIESFIFFKQKYDEFPNVLINFLTDNESKLLILRAMLSGGSLLFLFERLNLDGELQHNLSETNRELFNNFWETYQTESKRLKQLGASINTFTKEEDKAITSIHDRLMNAHPDHKIAEIAKKSFEAQYENAHGKSLNEAQMQERKTVFSQNAETHNRYLALQNEFKQCLQINPNGFFGKSGSLERHQKQEKNYQAAVKRMSN